MDDRVLVGADAERRVLVRDTTQHHVGPVVRVVDQIRGEGRDGSRERLALRAGGLVGAVEQVAEQVRVGREQLPVEALGDVLDGGADGGERGADDGGRRLGEHRRLLNMHMRFAF